MFGNRDHNESSLPAVTRHNVYHTQDTIRQRDCMYIKYRGSGQKKETDLPGDWVKSSRCDHGYQSYKSTTNYAIWRMNMNVVLQCENQVSDCQSIIYISTINEYLLNMFVTNDHLFAEYMILI